MNTLLSRQATTNVLLFALVILNFVALVIFSSRVGKAQRTLNFIGGNTSNMESSLDQVQDDIKYIQISTEETVNILER